MNETSISGLLFRSFGTSRYDLRLCRKACGVCVAGMIRYAFHSGKFSMRKWMNETGLLRQKELSLPICFLLFENLKGSIGRSVDFSL